MSTTSSTPQVDLPHCRFRIRRPTAAGVLVSCCNPLCSQFDEQVANCAGCTHMNDPWPDTIPDNHPIWRGHPEPVAGVHYVGSKIVHGPVTVSAINLADYPVLGPTGPTGPDAKSVINATTVTTASAAPINVGPSRPPRPDTPKTPVVLPPSTPRPDLAAIETTLPAPSPKDEERTFGRPVFGDDGSITYPKKPGDWEPPQLPNEGYVRDPDNQWRFLPLWPTCSLRHQMAFIKATCGCIGVIMRCNNPQAPQFGQRLAHTTCETCPVRKK